MQESTLIELEKLFLALSDKTRMRLLALMARGEVSVGFLAESLGESQPKISRHLAYLRNAGLVFTRREGKWIYYGIEDPDDEAVTRVLETTLSLIAAGSADGTGPIKSHANDIYADTDMNDWRPNELAVFLL